MIAIFGVVFATSGCAQMQQEWEQRWIETHCSYDAAYLDGLNDQQNADQPEVDPYQKCPSDAQTAAIRGYRDGYSKGMELDAVAASGRISVGIHTDDEPRYICEIEAFGEVFTGEAVEKSDARRLAFADCVAEHDDMFCGEATCRRRK